MQNVFRRLERELLSFNLRFFLITLMGFVGIVFSSHATPVGTLIQNTATVNFSIAGNPDVAVSNTLSFSVDELVAFSFVSNNPSGVPVQSPEVIAVLSFTITNDGNGSETFTLSTVQSVSDEFDPSASQIYLDSNANSTYDDGVDTLYTPTVNDPTLAMGTSQVVFVVSTIPSSLNFNDEAELTFTTTSNTLEGIGTGDGGVDSVMGLQGQSVNVNNKYIVSDTAVTQLTKTHTVLDPLGGSAPIQNAVITYTLVLDVTGSGSITSAQIADSIPAGTTYEPGTLTLNATPLTDAADVDPGVFNLTEIQVLLGTVTAPTTHTVTFKVRIQ